jgi:MFS transporter, DHA1 family, multidrug resistance protein
MTLPPASGSNTARLTAERDPESRPATASAEFTALMACTMSLAALSTDIMIPGLMSMGRELHVSLNTDLELIVIAVFFGLAPGQLLFGPLADSVGRKPTMLTGIGIFLLGSLMTVLAPSFVWLLLGRSLQGLGVAAPRTLTLAIIRDRYVGAAMARIISNVMSVFACIPMLAPIVGQLILDRSGWRGIFAFVLVFGLLVWTWFLLRQKETLAVGARAPLSRKALVMAVTTVCGNPAVLCYALAAGCVFAGFVAYMSGAAQIFQQIYDTGHAFGFLFSLVGVGMVVASYLNGRWVERLGMKPICVVGLVGVLAISAVFGGWMWLAGTKPALAWVVVYLTAIMFIEGALYANLNALAMEPLGESAGMGASVVSTIAMLSSVPMGMWFAAFLRTSILPLVIAFAILGALTLLMMYLASVGHHHMARRAAV